LGSKETQEWLNLNVFRHLENAQKVTRTEARELINRFVGVWVEAEFWAWRGWQDWTHMIELMGGWGLTPPGFPLVYWDWVCVCERFGYRWKPDNFMKYENKHSALEDARGLMMAMKALESWNITKLEPDESVKTGKFLIKPNPTSVSSQIQKEVDIL